MPKNTKEPLPEFVIVGKEGASAWQVEPPVLKPEGIEGCIPEFAAVLNALAKLGYRVAGNGSMISSTPFDRSAVAVILQRQSK